MTTPAALRVCFVDDEPAILDALRRTLHRLQVPWQCRFHTDAASALTALHQEPADVLVTDIRMPGMDGPALLQEAAVAWPDMLRLVLSGYDDQDRALRIAGLAHQYLPKPCDSRRLVELIQRGCAVRILCQDAELRRLVAPLSDLPIASSAQAALRQALSRSDCDYDLLAEVVASDPALTAKLLKLANAPLICPTGGIGTLHQALQLLGIERLRSLTLVLGYFSYADAAFERRFDLDLWYARTQGIARIAEALGRIEDCDGVLVQQAVTASLLLDIGMLVFATVAADRYDEILLLDERELLRREVAVFGLTHAEVGAHLCGLWNIPLPITEAVRHHPHPPRRADAGFDLVALCHCAVMLYEEVHGLGHEGLLDTDYLQAIGRGERIGQWRALAADCAVGT